MTVTSVDKDYDSLTVTLIADFDNPIDQVWELWSDPRKLERWWGPPGYPATVENHALTPGGEVSYFMTGPDGDQLWGRWRVTSVDPPTSLQFTDACADSQGAPLEIRRSARSQFGSSSTGAARAWSCAWGSRPARTWSESWKWARSRG
jgi:uncharacterized protein YndB with AHSA1/START domain